jgi:hypothetical protein
MTSVRQAQSWSSEIVSVLKSNPCEAGGSPGDTLMVTVLEAAVSVHSSFLAGQLGFYSKNTTLLPNDLAIAKMCKWEGLLITNENSPRKRNRSTNYLLSPDPTPTLCCVLLLCERNH